MPAAWSDAVDYALGDVVTHGGHTYEWSSADNDAAVEPPAGSWVQLDAAPTGASVDWAAVDAEVVNLTATEAITILSAGETGGSATIGATAPDESASAGVSTTVENGAASSHVSATGVGSQVHVAADGEDCTLYLSADGTNGRVQIMADGEVAIRLRSPNGTAYWLTVTDDGTLVAEAD